MNNIKVKAWDNLRKKMFTSPKWVNFSVDTGGVLSAENYDYKGNVQKLEILQSTGLKDKNGVEIYRGDVVLVERADGCFGRATYEEREVVGKPSYNELAGICSGGAEGYDKVVSRIVLGNIYENPELLEN